MVQLIQSKGVIINKKLPHKLDTTFFHSGKINYQNIDIDKEEKLAYDFVNIFINNELYKKNKNPPLFL